ncbi:MAG TPA: hypothetical protein VL443_15795 [Cyclobacteriaceae bacterium]|jgi:hypothetical protein|nr:hypothetical protein [Cyclobacteriaceae bacterium]
MQLYSKLEILFALFSRWTSYFTFVFGISIGSYGQSESQIAIPNSFHEFRLGSPLRVFLEKYPNVKKEKPSELSSTVKTDSMDIYSLRNQVTKSGDRIWITLCFYRESLSVMQVEYKDWQSGKVLLGALKEKYGIETRYEDNVLTYNGRSQIVENLYWEKFQCCMLAFSYNSDNGSAYLVFADEEVQKRLKLRELKESEKKIN